MYGALIYVLLFVCNYEGTINLVKTKKKIVNFDLSVSEKSDSRKWHLDIRFGVTSLSGKSASTSVRVRRSESSEEPDPERLPSFSPFSGFWKPLKEEFWSTEKIFRREIFVATEPRLQSFRRFGVICYCCCCCCYFICYF